MNRLLLLILFTCSLFSVAIAKPITIQVVTEDTFPIQYLNNGEVAGPATDLLKEVLNKAGVQYTIKMQPWARAYKMAQDQPNVLIYSIARTPAREPLFKWVGGIIQMNYYLVGLGSAKKNSFESLTDIKHEPIGALRNSATHLYLLEQGFDNIYPVSHARQSINMLKKGRIKYFPTNYESFQLSCLGMKISCREIKPVFELKELRTSLYFAFSKKTDDELVEQVKKAYNEIMLQ